MSPITMPDLAFLAVLAAFWRQGLMVIDRIRGIAVHRVNLRGSVARAVSDYLLSEAKVIRWGDQMVESVTAWVRPENRMREVAYEVPPGKPMLAIWNGRMLSFRRSMEGTGNGGEATVGGDHNLIIMYVRGTIDIKLLTRCALDWMTERSTTGSRFRITHIGESGRPETDQPMSASPQSEESVRPGMKYLHWEESEVGPPSPKEPFSSYALGEVAGEAREDFRRWCELKEWYLERGIPWRRGHLLYGPPGTGKTALVRALAQEADMPVFAYDLSSLDNHSFRYKWRDMQENAPCIALIEDIDGVFNGRENVLAKNNTHRESMTFDCLLNALGGIETADGVFIYITTNKPDLLDEAIGRPTDDGGTTRPGRLDRSFCLTLPSLEQRRSILQRIFGENEVPVEATEGMTCAQVTDWAVMEALRKKWETEEVVSQ